MKLRIEEYDSVDPSGVLHMNLLSLGYPLTPKLVALMRRVDPRPLPFFGVYATVDGVVAGQVLVYRLPMMTTEGAEDVGGVCAVCTNPGFTRMGIATRLLDEAHHRMRTVGLRFSTLGTTRHRAAHALYLRDGYEDAFTAAVTFASYQRVRCDGSLRAERADGQRLYLAESLFQRVSAGRLGFSLRPERFMQMMVAIGDLAADAVWLLWDEDELVGYALCRLTDSVLQVDNLLLTEGVDAASAVSAIAQQAESAYVQVRVDQPLVASSLRQAGYPTELTGWSTFMVKSLVPDVNVADARRLFGIGTNRFMISPIDVT
jgi:GNAT superfamily N-acetyltransferase